MEYSREVLEESIKTYEKQLAAVDAAISNAPADKLEELTSLKENIKELLALTQMSLEAVEEKEKQENPDDDDPFAKEYALFKAEVESVDVSSNDDSSSNQNQDPDVEDGRGSPEVVDIQDELSELIGSKCQAPFTNKLSVTAYYNALVASVHLENDASDIEHIQVRVMFVNPTEKEMIPCPYFLDGKCKFSDSKCNFSHGHIVPFNMLKEYKEPDFGMLRKGCRVLAKPDSSQVWVSTRVEEVLSDDVCSVKFRGVSTQVPTHNLFPLIGTTDDIESDEDEELDEIRAFNVDSITDYIVEQSLTNTPASEKIGAWEKHTKGIGSKLMAKMGYIVGAGLGKLGEGRLEPVQATILPPGKSLDHCMSLREAAGGAKDLFSVEKMQKKLAMKAARQSARQYKREQEKEKHNVFNIINDTLATVPKKEKSGLKSSRDLKRELASSSGRQLNVEKLKAEEEAETLAREAQVLREKLALKKEGSLEYKHLAGRLRTAESRLEHLRTKHGKIQWEINTRQTKKDLSF